ncbi:flagellar biosynthesis anti-sigma factor FlgM [Xylophilus ampelinus]|uniref:Negative regulator of flagellin synthesis n=1 Tax=Xylophilus ampelinus TaxID=54067 RepID=A0A318SW10_9BURK|nr:flagellar biosynthesis anti-sigma factor FlgM [Xylophilus ampelinus]MCS4511223.1 flagellar biosynthesis anti-sigma factor FlgM [Xylophilus ampelinus]PYE75024.1 FlgM family anti-sigma-28 factor [Xylophilus ampelinus]
MKINPSLQADLLKAPAARTGAAAAPAVGSTATAAAAPAATVTVSNLARSMETRAAAGVAADTSGDFNAAKVAEVKAAIAQGTYKVNAGAIADKLLSNAQQVLRRNASDADRSDAGGA